MKLMNFHSLAEFIQHQVQQLIGKEASINTLVVAIKRFSDTLSNGKSPDASRVLKDARISLSSGIVDVTIRAPRNQFSAIVKELSEAAGELSEFPPHLPPLKLDQTDSARRGLHPRPGKNGATERSGDTGKCCQTSTQPVASRRDDTRNSILRH